MRRRLLAITMAVSVLTIISAGAVLAAKPSSTCGNAASGFVRVDSAGWWERTVAGFAIAGIAVYEDDGEGGLQFTAEFDAVAESFGFADGQALYEFIVGPQWAIIDRDGKGFACMKERPVGPSNPGYIFNGVDDRASVP